MSDEPTFNPRAAVKRITRGKGSYQYMQVKDRVFWFRSEHPEGIIDTELVRWDAEAGVAVVKALITIPGAGVATSLGSACRTDLAAKAERGAVQPDQVESYVEFAETAAIGRALGRLGYGTEDALDEAGPVDSPRETAADPPASGPPSARQEATTAPAGTAPPTSVSADLPDPAAIRDLQLKQIRALLPRLGKSEADYEAVNLRGRALTSLSAIEAQKVIDWCQAQLKRKGQASA